MPYDLRLLLATVPAMLSAEARMVCGEVSRLAKRFGEELPDGKALAYDMGLSYSLDATEAGPHGLAVLINPFGFGEVKSEGSEGAFTLPLMAGQAALVHVETP